MKKYTAAHPIFAVVCVLALITCSCQTLSALSPEPTIIPSPAATSTPRQTSIPASTFTPAAYPTPVLGERQSVDAGGYSFQLPYGFTAKSLSGLTTITSKENTIAIRLFTIPREDVTQNDETQNLETLMYILLANTIESNEGLKIGQPRPISISKVDGLVADIRGPFYGIPSTGQVVLVEAGQAGFLVVYAFVEIDDTDEEKRWKSEGIPVFEAILNSIEFFKPFSTYTTDFCPMSDDPTYGYTQENPIRVGGEAFDGPARERTYLDNLIGAGGEEFSYERRSMDIGKTILDVYTITGLNEPVTLYIDEYSYTEPQAPVGFTCLSDEFPIFQP